MNNREPRNSLDKFERKQSEDAEIANRNLEATKYPTPPQYVGKYMIPRGEEQSRFQEMLGYLSNKGRSATRRFKGIFTRKNLSTHMEEVMKKRKEGMAKRGIVIHGGKRHKKQKKHRKTFKRKQ
jgi:hypothetical protein